MQHHEIVAQLSRPFPSEVIYSLTMEAVISLIVDRLGRKALTLTPAELRLAGEEVRMAIDHHLDIRDYINMGLDSWEVIRSL